MENSGDGWVRLGEIILKIVGGILVVISFRWVARIFKGKDQEFSVIEFGRMVGTVFFLVAGGYMLWMEGNRAHEWHLYSEWYIAIVFGSLLSVLHLDHALEVMIKMFDRVIELRKSFRKDEENNKGEK